MIDELYPTGWKDDVTYGYRSSGRLVRMLADDGTAIVGVNMGIAPDLVSATVRLPDACDLALSRRVADAMAAAALDVVTAYRAGNEERCHV